MESVSLHEVTTVSEVGPGAFTASIDPDWVIFGANGGYLVALPSGPLVGRPGSAVP